MTDIEKALQHFRRYHARHRQSGWAPNPTPEEHEARRAEEQRVAEESLGDLSELSADLRAELVDRVIRARREARVNALIAALPKRREPAPHRLEGCGWPTPEERQIIARGHLVRVRNDIRNDR